MVSKRLVQLTLCAAVAHAFRDASPFFLFSTSKLPHIDSLPAQKVSKASSIDQSLLKALQKCPSATYVFVSQPGVSTQDFDSPVSALHLKTRMSSRGPDLIKTTYHVPHMIGKLDTAPLEQHVSEKCGAKPVQVNATDFSFVRSKEYPQLIKVDFPELPVDAKQRTTMKTQQDSFLKSVLDELPGSTYTVFYTTTPPSQDVLERLQEQGQPTAPKVVKWEAAKGFEDTSHSDLKRDVKGSTSKRQADSDDNDAGLFEKYNFLSAGIFMGGIAVILLFAILSFAIQSVSGLEVSYAAFNKENGPAAQKKQQ